MMRYRTTSSTTSPPTSPPTPPTTPFTSPSGRFLARVGTWPVVLGSGVVFLLFAAIFFSSSAPFSIPTVEEACGSAPLDVRAYSSGDDVHRFLGDCQETGRAAYRNLQLADLFYPVVVGLFMTSALSMTLRRLFPWSPSAISVAWLGMAGSVFDYLENIAAWFALAAYPEPAFTDGALGLASAAKTLTSWLAGVTLIVGVLALGARAVRRRLS